MKKLEVRCEFSEYESADELSAQDQQLLNEARANLRKAYAPYSGFQVGAALLLEDGTVIGGNNQENASYPLGMCAERVAIFYAGASHPGKKIVTIAIIARSNDFIVDKPVAPCGACRQAIAEYEHRYKQPIRLLLSGERGKVLLAEGIDPLLPFQFNADDLQVKTS